MATNAVTTRKGRSKAEARRLPSPTLARRLGWVLLAGMWSFLLLVLLSFDSADAPSHAVAVHNQPAANWCGAAGAVIAYWGYEILGMGSWMLMLGLMIVLAVTVTGRVVNQPLVRIAG